MKWSSITNWAVLAKMVLAGPIRRRRLAARKKGYLRHLDSLKGQSQESRHMSYPDWEFWVYGNNIEIEEKQS